ncbi:MAG: polysaccharide biosynthesis/export family protein [Rubrivivax sp.]|nr:polysaccharide biosynthesis/export family protein [Rubrivivax sp.]
MLTLSACSQMPTSGPSQGEIERTRADAGAPTVQLVDVDQSVVRALAGSRKVQLFSDSLGMQAPQDQGRLGTGDTVEVHIWEAPPATLFGAGPADSRIGVATSRPTTLPEQVVDREGFIVVPFVGRLRVGGQMPRVVEAEIAQRLKGKANQPEVVIRVTRNASSMVTVVGEVTNSLRMPLTASGERLLDALAAAGGVRQPVTKMTLQVTRGSAAHALPLDLVIRDPRQNVPLLAGDVVTALFQPLSFTALGATGRNEEVSFETQGISLAQAIARTGGLVDTRSSPQGVFIFRMEPKSALAWPKEPVEVSPDGLVPVVYRIDLRRANSFFVMQGFQMQNKDVLYVSNAPAAELQKFLNIVFSIFYPVANAISLTR